MLVTFLENLTSYFANARKQYSFMAVFGIGTKDVDWRDYQNRDKISGYQS